MNMRNSFPYNGSELVLNEYEKDNYKIIRTEASTRRAIIFFTGGGLYFPNTEANFIENVIVQDRYEWANIASDSFIQQYYELIILVLDIYKQWYVDGINSRCSNIDKTAELLRNAFFLFPLYTHP